MAAMTDMPKLLLLLWLPYQVTHAYTATDLFSDCTPCRPGDKLIHPTDCKKYYYCSNIGIWRATTCPASTYFEQNPPNYPCINPAEFSGDRKKCRYERPGETTNEFVPITNFAECSRTTSASPTRSSTRSTATQDMLVTPSPDNDFLTKLLASLLGVTVVILLAVILGVFIYRRVQASRRPTNFYRRALPSIKKPVGAPSYNNSTNQPSAANAAYLTRSLLNRGNQPGETIPSQPGDDADAAYSEIPDLPDYEDPSNNPGFHGPPGSHGYLRDDDAANHIYAEANTLPVHMTEPGYQQARDPGYQHPNVIPDNHTYTHPSPEVSQDTDPYTYHKPASVSIPDYASQKASTQDVTSSPPSSPPYYIDPIADDDGEIIQPHQYHTLEPTIKNKS